MKGNKSHFIKSQEIFSVLVLSGILSLSTGLTLLQTANAAVSNASPKNEKIKEVLISDRGRGGDDDQKRDRSDDKYEREDDRNRGNDDQYEDDQGEDTDRLPRTVANAIRQDLASKVGIAPAKLKIINYSRETWSDGCLGLGTAAELCLQAQVEGWRVTLSDGRFSWVYRTDLQGLVLRLENQIAADLPPAVADAVLQATSKQSGLLSKLRIIGAEQREWSDGCLGLAKPDEICTLAIVPGWLVTVEAGQQKLVYRTNADGSAVRLDEVATAAMLNPVPFKASELPPLQKEVIFRAIASGGIANITYEINLFEDGRVIKSDGTTSTVIKQVSEEQADQFKKLLNKQDFEEFNNLSYPAPSGTADYITVTFTSRKGTTRYTDISQDRLPSSLRAVIRAWGELTAVE